MHKYFDKNLVMMIGFSRWHSNGLCWHCRGIPTDLMCTQLSAILATGNEVGEWPGCSPIQKAVFVVPIGRYCCWTEVHWNCTNFFIGKK
jgi:hypothetical protein